MRKLCLIVLASPAFDGAPIVKAFENAFSELDLDAEIKLVHADPSGKMSAKQLDSFKHLVQKYSADRFVIFHSGLHEFFLQDPDFLLLFSAYQSWFDPTRTRVLPHVWTPIGIPQNIEALKWQTKPALRLGFMGTLHNTSRLHRILLRLPQPVRRWLISGTYLRNARLNATINDLGFPTRNLNTFVRSETLDTLRLKLGDHKNSNIELEIVERRAFGGEQQHMLEYQKHLEECTYVICPRGIENYSYRMYEALNFGRVPVIIDTDMVLPKEIDWERLSVRVPYKSLNQIYDYILDDYRSKSEQDFKDRQQAAISTMLELQTSRWVKTAVEEILKSASA